MIMNKYPCKGCIIYGICHESCGKTTSVKNMYKRIKNEERCPDCGNTKGITYDGEYMYDGTYLLVIECTGCHSSFYPTIVAGKLVGIYRFAKNWTETDKRNFYSTTFKKYINDRIY
jgi:hypothetical protein